MTYSLCHPLSFCLSGTVQLLLFYSVIFSHSYVLSLYLDVISYRSQQPFLLLEGGTAAQHACYHDDDSSQDQYVGGGSVGLGGEKADVVALQDQGPNTHRHYNAPCQLGEEHMMSSVSASGQPGKQEPRLWCRTLNNTEAESDKKVSIINLPSRLQSDKVGA